MKTKPRDLEFAPSRGRTRNSISIAGLALCASFIFLLAGCGGGKDSSQPGVAPPKDAKPEIPTVSVVKVVAKRPVLTDRLPGELTPYEVVAVFPKVTGFVEWIGVDRGSRVKNGEIIARLVAPEISSQRLEAESKVQSAKAQRLEAEAKLAADEGTYERLRNAASVPGVISGNELEVSLKTVEADRARVRGLKDGEEAAKAALKSLQEIESYLQVKAPFDGIVTERNVHPGALVGPTGAAGVTVPLLRIETVTRLRLLVPVPEKEVAGIATGASVSFTVPAFPGESFSGKVARIAHSIDIKTRTMPVEVDVMNPSGRLSSGMFPEVLWPVQRSTATLFVPSSSVVRTTERIFVVRLQGNKAEWVDVNPGLTVGNQVEVFGNLREGDQVAARGTDEIRPGAEVPIKLLPAQDY